LEFVFDPPGELFALYGSLGKLDGAGQYFPLPADRRNHVRPVELEEKSGEALHERLVCSVQGIAG
jgi:hypothetical protein